MPRNRILAALPREEYDRLLPRLEPITLSLKLILYQPNAPIDYVYFFEKGVGSLITIMEDGASVEFGTVGNEGMVGLPLLLGQDTIPSQALVQVSGEGLRMKAADFKAETGRESALQKILLRYTQTLFNQVAQSAACNRLHSIEERCSRWLLMTHDRAGSDHFNLTQEFLATMLGVRRATVTVAAGILQKAGLIYYTRGSITVLDRAGLEEASCECYQIIRREYDRLFGVENNNPPSTTQPQ